jgi:hypothetical protein
MINRRTAILAALYAAIGQSSTAAENDKSVRGPFCWAGKTEEGPDRFIPCHLDVAQLTWILCDLGQHAGLKILLGQESRLISSEDIFNALAAPGEAVHPATP